MGPVDVPDDAYHTSAAAAPHFAPNRWPARPARFQPAFEAYYRALPALGDTLLGGFALALGLEERWFAAPSNASRDAKGPGCGMRRPHRAPIG